MNTYAVVSSGGSIGEISQCTHFYKGMRVIVTGLEKEEAHAKVKRLRQGLSKMDKVYYHVKYKTVQI